MYGDKAHAKIENAVSDIKEKLAEITQIEESVNRLVELI